jgi:hypothetical protein
LGRRRHWQIPQKVVGRRRHWKIPHKGVGVVTGRSPKRWWVVVVTGRSPKRWWVVEYIPDGVHIDLDQGHVAHMPDLEEHDLLGTNSSANGSRQHATHARVKALPHEGL